MQRQRIAARIFAIALEEMLASRGDACLHGDASPYGFGVQDRVTLKRLTVLDRSGNAAKAQAAYGRVHGVSFFDNIQNMIGRLIIGRTNPYRPPVLQEMARHRQQLRALICPRCDIWHLYSSSHQRRIIRQRSPKANAVRGDTEPGAQNKIVPRRLTPTSQLDALRLSPSKRPIPST